jgi:membrane associated rhomboid family serine protease
VILQKLRCRPLLVNLLVHYRSSIGLQRLPFRAPKRPSTATMESTESRHGLTAMALLYLTIVVTLWVHQEPSLFTDWLSYSSSSLWDYQWHSHKYTTVPSMLVSLFTHADWEHVLSNMFLLAWTGRQLFVAGISLDRSARRRASERNDQTSSAHQAWTHPFAFVWVYVGSQILSAVGCRAISYWLDWSWERQLIHNRAQWTWGWIPDSWKDVYSTVVLHPQQAVDLRIWQYAPMIGASAAVFGVVGAHVYAAVFAPDHPAKMDPRTQAVWLCAIAVEFSMTPFSLEQITKVGRWSSSNIDEYDDIDHASHLCGFVGGFVLAILWDRFSKRWDQRSRHDEIAYHNL